MLERDRLSLRAWREQCTAEEKAEQEERERPIRELEAGIQKTQRELLRIEREQLTGKVEDPKLRERLKGKPLLDPDVFVDERTFVLYPEIVNDPAYKQEFNAASIRLFREKHPSVYWSNELVSALDAYFDNNDLELTSVPMIEAAVSRILDAGLAPRNSPTPEPAPEPIPFEHPVIQEQKPIEPEFVDGWDLESGEPKQWTRRALDRLSSTDYRRALRLYKEHLAIPQRHIGQ